MNILIDLTQIPQNKVGVGVYAVETFQRVVRQDTINHYLLVIQDDDEVLRQLFVETNATIIPVSGRIFRRMPCRVIMEQFYFPWLILKYKIDIVHSLHYSFPLIHFRAKRVVTLHDMTFFLFPEVHEKIKRIYFRWFIAQAVRRVDKIICVSDSTASDLMKYFPHLSKQKVEIIKLACSVPARIKQSPFPSPYIAFIGTLEPRKNINLLIEAFANANLHDYKLVIVGKKGWFYQEIFDLVQTYRLKNQVIFTGFVSDEQKFAILKSATLFVYPSIYEGFGLPVLEALTLGIPTITSNVSSKPEVAGQAAELVNPNSVAELTQAMIELVRDKRLQNELTLKGKQQAAKFSWNNTALQTQKLYMTYDHSQYRNL